MAFGDVIQAVSNTTLMANGDSITIAAPAAGNALVMHLIHIGNGVTVNGFTNNNGAAVWSLIQAQGGGGIQSIELWICPNAAGTETTVTANLTINYGVKGIDVILLEIEGVAHTSPVDTNNGADGVPGNGLSIGSGLSITPTAGNDYCLVGNCMGEVGAGATTTTGWTDEGVDLSGDGRIAKRVITSASGSYNCCIWPGLGNNYNAWHAIMAALKKQVGVAAVKPYWQHASQHVIGTPHV